MDGCCSLRQSIRSEASQLYEFALCRRGVWMGLEREPGAVILLDQALLAGCE